MCGQYHQLQNSRYQTVIIFTKFRHKLGFYISKNLLSIKNMFPTINENYPTTDKMLAPDPFKEHVQDKKRRWLNWPLLSPPVSDLTHLLII